MAWGGKTQTRRTEKQRKAFLKTLNRSLPPVDNPFGIKLYLEPTSSEQLPDKESYSRRLNELLTAIKQNGGSNGS